MVYTSLISVTPPQLFFWFQKPASFINLNTIHLYYFSLIVLDRWQIPARTQGWWGGASIESKSIYKCNLTVTHHKAGELLDIQPARA